MFEEYQLQILIVLIAIIIIISVWIVLLNRDTLGFTPKEVQDILKLQEHKKKEARRRER